MTTTTNDANAEQATKLVRDLLEGTECLLQGDVHPGSKRTRELAMNIREYIERHTTQQTQATHGEGELVWPQWPHMTFDDNCPRCQGRGVVQLGGSSRNPCECGKYDPPKYHPAPSPTTAPALGELVEALLDGADSLEHGENNEALSCAASMRKAAAALSGVAAQGDGT